MLKVNGLSFSYGEKKILENVSFDIAEKSIVSVLGPNGVGKTTLMKCVCDFHRPSAGTVSVDGFDIRELPKRELAKEIGYIPQKVMPVQMTVFDSVLIGRRPYIDWFVTKEDKEIAWDAIKALGLEELSLNFTDKISGGEFQKVQIARALVQDPKVLVLDEPTSNLDLLNQHLSMHMIVNAVRSKGMSAMITMHDINLAIHYSDRFVFIKDGKVFASGNISVITEDLIKDVYGLEVDMIDHGGVPYIIPCRCQPGIEKNRHLEDHAHPHDAADHVHEKYGDRV